MSVVSGVLRDQRRALLLWGVAVAAVTAMYVGFWPAMGESADIEAFVQNMPEGLVQALGYDQIATPAGYLRSTVYGLLAPALLLVFAIAGGARLLAGQEEDGTLELELTSPVARRHLLGGRLLALWFDLTVLAAVVTLMTLALATVVDMEVGATEILAGGSGLLLFAVAFATLAMAVGAATGRRSHALAVAAAVAVVSFLFNAIGPMTDAGWMTAVSPFSWYLEPNPLAHGFNIGGLVLLGIVTLIGVAVGLITFERRDLMV